MSNLLAWSMRNTLAVGVGSCVYVWGVGRPGDGHRLCRSDAGAISSVSWGATGNAVSAGTSDGTLHVWDVGTARVPWELNADGPSGNRIGVSAWLDERQFWAGNKEGTSEIPTGILQGRLGHLQESSKDRLGGGMAMRVGWGYACNAPEAHISRVLNPRSGGVLVAGGGEADRRICTWYTVSGKTLACMVARSQVCGIAFSPMGDGFVTFPRMPQWGSFGLEYPHEADGGHLAWAFGAGALYRP